MDVQTSDSHIPSYTIRYDLASDSILFYPDGINIEKQPLSMYITVFRNIDDHAVLGIQLGELRMMLMSLITNGALKIGEPLPLEDVLCVALRLSGPIPEYNEAIHQLRRITQLIQLPSEELDELLTYPMGWN